MRHGNRGIGGQQKLRRGLAEQQRAADDEHVPACDVAQGFLEQDHHARRRTGYQLGAAAEKQAGIGGGQRIHILGGIERVEYRLFANLFGQRQLDENSVYGFVGVERADPRQDVGFAGVGGQMKMDGFEAQRLGHLVLVTDIDLTRGIGAHQDGRQTGHHTVFGFEPGGFFGQTDAQVRRMGLAVDDGSSHGASPNA